MAKKKKRARYGDGVEMRGEKIYGVWLEPQPDGGYKRRRKLCDNAIEARQWADEQKQKFGKGNRQPKQPAGATFADLAAWYEREHLIEPIYENGVRVDGVKDWRQQRVKLRAISNYFGAYRMADIDEAALKAFVRFRRDSDGVKTATINRDLALIRSMFIKAGISPRPKFPINHAAETERDRVLSFEEEKRLLSHCVASERVEYKIRGKSRADTFDAKREHLRLPIIMAVDTAMRKGEMMKLKWKDIDLKRGIITIHAENAKTQRTRTVGITVRLKAELAKLKADVRPTAASLVFTHGNWHKAFKSACAKTRANIHDLRWHDLRHTATTRMIRAGIPYLEVMKITGHTQMKTFLRYLNIESHAVQLAASALSEMVDANTA